MVGARHGRFLDAASSTVPTVVLSSAAAAERLDPGRRRRRGGYGEVPAVIGISNRPRAGALRGSSPSGIRLPRSCSTRPGRRPRCSAPCPSRAWSAACMGRPGGASSEADAAATIGCPRGGPPPTRRCATAAGDQAPWPSSSGASASPTPRSSPCWNGAEMARAAPRRTPAGHIASQFLAEAGVLAATADQPRRWQAATAIYARSRGWLCRRPSASALAAVPGSPAVVSLIAGVSPVIRQRDSIPPESTADEAGAGEGLWRRRRARRPPPRRRPLSGRAVAGDRQLAAAGAGNRRGDRRRPSSPAGTRPASGRGGVHLDPHRESLAQVASVGSGTHSSPSNTHPGQSVARSPPTLAPALLNVSVLFAWYAALCVVNDVAVDVDECDRRRPAVELRLVAERHPDERRAAHADRRDRVTERSLAIVVVGAVVVDPDRSAPAPSSWSLWSSRCIRTAATGSVARVTGLIRPDDRGAERHEPMRCPGSHPT